MKTKIWCALVTFGLALSGIASADSLDDFARVKVKVINSSGYTIEELYLTRVGSIPTADILGSDVLESGYVETIMTSPGLYALRLVDSDGDVCVRNINIRSDRIVTVTPEALIRCEREYAES